MYFFEQAYILLAAKFTPSKCVRQGWQANDIKYKAQSVVIPIRNKKTSFFYLPHEMGQRARLVRMLCGTIRLRQALLVELKSCDDFN